MRSALLAAVLAVLSLPALAQGRDCGQLPPGFEGIAFAGDGDTLYGVGYAPPIRLWGVQAPELRDAGKAETVSGMRARALVEDLLAASGHRVRCQAWKWDRYCRVVGPCQAGDKELGLELIRAGLGYGYWLADVKDATVERSLAYARAEAEARREKAGQWRRWVAD